VRLEPAYGRACEHSVICRSPNGTRSKPPMYER
jgi:hypothetical protein